MFPPPQSIDLDLAAISGITGSISIACWVVVFSPQIIKNFRRSSADGVSIVFLVTWLAGDVFNILGALLQGVLPTMIILAVYYTLADIVLIAQVWYYRGFTLSDSKSSPQQSNGHAEAGASERRPLLQDDTRTAPTSRDDPEAEDHHRRYSPFSQLDGAHYSPATPLHDDYVDSAAHKTPNAIRAPTKPTPIYLQILSNATAVLLVFIAGFLGWYLSQYSSSSSHRRHHHHHHHNPDQTPPDNLEYDTWGQFWGWLCAVFYLGSRIPQIIMNHRSKSTEGLSLLFFLFACLGNLTFDVSIFAFDPTTLCYEGGILGSCADGEARAIYLRYLGVNASWIVGSLGTLVLDMAIFVQFFLYRKDDDEEDDVEEFLVAGSNGVAGQS